jgi:hypothetical protein
VCKVSAPIFHAIVLHPQELPAAHLGLVLEASLRKRRDHHQNANSRDRCPEADHGGNIDSFDTFEFVVRAKLSTFSISPESLPVLHAGRACVFFVSQF